MIWLIWRQHRLPAALALVVLAAFAVPAEITGRHLADTFAACRASGCAGYDVFRGYNGMDVIVVLTVAVPLIIGAFWGATLLGKELETGTATLVWTQGVTRAHWLRGKLLTLFGSAFLVSAATAALVSWWSRPHNALVESRFTGVEFDIQGIVPVAYTLFATAVGLAAGVFWRRVLPAMATTVAAFVAIRLIVELAFRPHFRAPATVLGSLGGPPPIPADSWQRGTEVLLHGRVVDGPVRVPGSCVGAATRPAMSRCLDALGYQVRTTYQPGNRFWTFQWIESAVFVGLAALLVVAALVALRRRDG